MAAKCVDSLLFAIVPGYLDILNIKISLVYKPDSCCLFIILFISEYLLIMALHYLRGYFITRYIN